jgi:uncharacterized membrane protein HdeD (DUF308 family)
MKNKAIYFGSLILIIILYVYASNYKLSPPIYKINKVNFESEQKMLTRPNDKDISVFDSIAFSRKIYERDSSAYLILDSIVENRLKERDYYLTTLDLKRYVLETKKDTLIIVNKPEQIEFINDIIRAVHLEELPGKYHKFAENGYGYLRSLYMKAEDLVLDVNRLNWDKIKYYYFVTNNNFKQGLIIKKINKLQTIEEKLSEGNFHSSNEVIPEEILYPYSSTKFWLIPFFILVALSPAFISIKNNLFPKQRKQYYNSQKTVAIVWLAMIFISLLVVLSVIVFEIDINAGGGAMIMLGTFLFICSIIIFIIYYKRAVQFDKIYTGSFSQNQKTDENIILARWTYDKIIWDEFVNLDQQEKLSTNKSTFILVSVLIVIIFGIFMIADPDIAPTMGIIGLGLILLLFFVSRFSPVLTAKRLKSSNPECIISKTGLILGKQFHNWKSLGNRLESVRFIKNEKHILEIIYSYPARYGRQNYTLLVPVPSDQFEKAEKIVEILQSEIN